MVRTRKSFIALALVVVSGLVLSSQVALAQNPGDSGLLFLRLGVGAREAGMGGAGVASSSGASAVYWNPANNVFADFQTELVLQHYDYLGNYDHESAAVAHKVGQGVLGFMFTGLYYGEQTRYGNDGVAVPDGTFDPYDITFGVSYARPIGEDLALGVNAKMVYEKIDIYSDSGFAFDLFLTHRSMIEGLIFAASATNIGGQMDLNAGAIDLPTAYRVGVAWTPANMFAERLTATCDILFPNDTTEKAHAGVEFRVIPELVLRGGSALNYDLRSWTAGAGFELGVVNLDYAYEDSKIDGFDSGHKFSVNFTW